MIKSRPNPDLVNERIPFREVLVIDQDGTQLGVMTTEAALNLAYNQDLDLLVVAPNARPPVCKILDYGKHYYIQQKKEKEMRKSQKIVQVKEIRLTTNIGEHDLRFKARKVIEFLKNGDRVKISLKFRGREIRRKEYGEKTLQTLFALVSEYGEIEKPPTQDGQFYNMYLVPKKKSAGMKEVQQND